MGRYRLRQLFLIQFLIALMLFAVQTENPGVIWIAWTALLMAVANSLKGDVPNAIIFIAAGWNSVALTFALFIFNGMPGRSLANYAEVMLFVVAPNTILPWTTIIAARRNSYWTLPLSIAWIPVVFFTAFLILVFIAGGD